MRLFFRILLSVGSVFLFSACSDTTQTATVSPSPSGASIHSIFEGITPCDRLTRPLPGIPAETDCEQMIWKLVLYQEPATGVPTSYVLDSAYGLSQPNTLGLIDGGMTITMEGSWAIGRGTKTDPDAVVYELNPDNPERAVSFVQISEEMIHVLGSEKTLLVGNGGWSYTLNRTDNQAATQAPAEPNSVPELATRPPTPPMPSGSSILGVFEGRMPCHDLVFEFTATLPYTGCMKIKWRLTLYQDQSTGKPSTYLYLGTSTIREGTWVAIQGALDNPEATIYQLRPDTSSEPVSFLRLDENHLFLLDRNLHLLVGDAFFSYTLSRTDRNAQ